MQEYIQNISYKGCNKMLRRVQLDTTAERNPEQLGQVCTHIQA